MVMNGLFVGRFQPFHLGHLEAVKWVLERCEKVTIAVGSSQASFTIRNPFTYEERKHWISSSLREEGIEQRRYEIIGVSDVFDCERWVKDILEKAEFQTVYTRSLWVKECFNLFGIPVMSHPLFGRVSASRIRKKMKEDAGWEDFVPEIVSQSIRRIRGSERLRSLAEG